MVISKMCLVVNSISKRSSAPGLRSGFIAGDSAILKEYMRYRTYIGTAIPLPLQKGGTVAWQDDSAPSYFRGIYQENLRIASKILGVEMPDATFYIWLEVENATEMAKELYRKYNVKVLPGEFLGRNGVGKEYWRIALVYEPEIITEAIERVKKFLGEFNNG